MSQSALLQPGSMVRRKSAASRRSALAATASPTRGRSGWRTNSVWAWRMLRSMQEDLLKHPDQSFSIEDTIKFVEVRAAGKRSALTMSTPLSTGTKTRLLSPAPITSSSALAPRSAQDPSKATSNRLHANPTSQQTATPPESHTGQ